MFDIGRVAIKTAGRDAGKYCIIIEKIDNTFVLIDGQVRRKKCNIKHLEPLDKVIDIKKDASHEHVIKALAKLNITVEKHTPKTKKTPKPTAKRATPQQSTTAPEQKKETSTTKTAARTKRAEKKS